LFEESVRYEALSRKGRPPLEIICSYDSLEVKV
jgi:hypothetical protein